MWTFSTFVVLEKINNVIVVADDVHRRFGGKEVVRIISRDVKGIGEKLLT